VGEKVWYYPVTPGFSKGTDAMRKPCVIATEPWEVGGSFVVHLNDDEGKRSVQAALLTHLKRRTE